MLLICFSEYFLIETMEILNINKTFFKNLNPIFKKKFQPSAFN